MGQECLEKIIKKIFKILNYGKKIAKKDINWNYFCPDLFQKVKNRYCKNAIFMLK